MSESLIAKTIRWLINSKAEFEKAGGNPNALEHVLPINVIEILVANNLHIVYRPPPSEPALKELDP